MSLISYNMFLQAIFGPAELKDLRNTDVWHTYRPPDIILTVTPQQGSSGPSEVYAQIDLHVTCGDAYPDTYDNNFNKQQIN